MAKIAEKPVSKAARSLTGRSPSDMETRKPVKGKGKADASGHNGHALAVTLIQEAEAKARAVAAEYRTLKERLTEINLLSHEDHVEFRKMMVERQNQVTNAAKLAGMNIMAYRSKNPESNTIYNACSEWKRLSEACDAGWKPDLSQSWAEIKGFATQHLDKVEREKAAAEKAPTLVEERNRILNTKGISAEKRAELIAPLEAKITEAIKDVYKPRARSTQGRKATAPTTPPVSGETGSNSVAVAQITKMLGEQPVPVILEVAAWLEKFLKSEEFQKREAAHKANLEAKSKGNDKINATPSERPSVPKDSQPAKEEKATASAGKTKGKRGRK